MRSSRNALAAALVALATLGCGESPVDPEELSAQTAPLGTSATGRSRDGILEHAAALGLTDAQVTQIEGIVETLRATNAPLLEQLRPESGERPARDEARELMQQVGDNARAAQEQILALLTDAQREQLSELRSDRRDGGERRGRGGFRNGRGFGPGGGAGAMLLRLREELELTEAQVTQLRTIGTELQAQNEPLLQQLRDAGQRPEPGDPTLVQIRENLAAASERMLAVLTDAQRAELDQLRQRREERGADGGGRRGPGRGSGGRGR